LTKGFLSFHETSRAIAAPLKTNIDALILQMYLIGLASLSIKPV
jgi:hypothetical protein